MKILYEGLRDPNHSSAGGYDWITHYPGAETLWDYQAPFSFIKPNQRGKRINLFFQDLKARKMAQDYDILHYFYGDNLRRSFHNNRNYKVVATIHMDINKKKNKSVFVDILKSLDGVITLSSSQQAHLQKIGISSVFIPHGFNKPIFNKQETGMDFSRINIVVSGSNYRDVEMLQAAIDYCEKNIKTVFFHLLGQPKGVKELLSNCSNALCYPRLDDDRYYSIIADCDYSFLPLTFATANNALLESQFLGVRSILPRITGIEDYAAPAPLNDYYGTWEELANILSNLTKQELDTEIQEYSEKFQWDNIYKQLERYYKTLSNA